MVLFFRLTESSTSLFWILLIVFIDALNSLAAKESLYMRKRRRSVMEKQPEKFGLDNIGVDIHLYNHKSNLVKVRWVGRVF